MMDDVSRRAVFGGALGVAGIAATAAAASAAEGPAQNASQRLSQRYRFDDDSMDVFFVACVGWAPMGGLSVGEAWYVASQIKDGDGDSWMRAFESYGDRLSAEADRMAAAGRTRTAGETRLKASASYRSAWQFAPPGKPFVDIVRKQSAAFSGVIQELKLPATRFQVPYKGKSLPGVFLQNPNRKAPTILVIGGADTGHEDLYLTAGAGLLERGFSVALVDLPGQGIVQASGLTWEAASEIPIGAVIDYLIANFGVKPGRIALMGMSLGGYFVTRAAGHEKRLAAVVASTPWPKPGLLFRASAGEGAPAEGSAGTGGAQRNMAVLAWKAGARSPEDFLRLGDAMVADPAKVSLPFLSIMGTGESAEFQRQAREWHAAIPSKDKAMVVLDAATGADGHCQLNNRERLIQETADWLAPRMA